MRISVHTPLFASVLSLCVAGSANAIDVYVGQGATCDASSLGEAIGIVAVSGPGPHTIHATSEIVYANQALAVPPVDLTVVGEHACDDATPEPVTINGDGSHSVISVSGSNNSTLTLRNLVIRAGGNDGSGGGLDIRGQVNVTLDRTLVRDNIADTGGGVYIENGVGNSSGILLLLPGSRIEDNTANQLGGGVFSSGGRVRMHAADTIIRGNASVGGGGGVALFDGELTSGKYVDDVVDGSATGALIEDNAAGTLGGGVYVFGAHAGVYAYELIVNANHATSAGGGIAASNGAHVTMQRDYPNAPSTFNCPAWRECSRFSGNSVAAGAQGTHGGAIALYAGARADIAQTIFRDNIAADGAAAWVDSATFNTESVLFSGNHSYDSPTHGSAVIRALYQAPAAPPQLRLAFVTFAGNLGTSSTGETHASNDILAMQNSTLALHSVALYDSPYTPTTYSAYTDDCVVRTTGGSMPDPYGTHTRTTVSETPGFNQAANGDFRLRSQSLLTDYCDASAYQPQTRDLVLTPRCEDDPRKPDAYGRCDVGAYESDQIFGNGMD